MLRDKIKIKEWLDKYKIENYTVNDDFTVDIDGSVDLYDKELSTIEVQFNCVTESFNCAKNKLTTLSGCPKKVEQYFDCSENHLTNLKESPKSVGKGFFCDRNKLTTLEWGQKL